ncbi:amine oxidase, partial [Ostertagia ostertagi]
MKAARGNSVKADLGGTWVCPTQPNILKLIEEFGLKAFPQHSNGTKWAQLGRPGWRPYSTSRPSKSIREFSLSEVMDLWWSVRKMEKLAEQVKVEDPFVWHQASELNGISLGHWIRQNVRGRSARDALEIAARATYGAEPTILWILTVMERKPCECRAEQNKLPSSLPTKIGKDRIILNRAVERFEVDESSGITRVHTYSTNAACEKIVYTCSQVICAIPLNQCAKISFSPPLPHLKQRLFDSCIPGNMIKFVITFETAFWRGEGWSGELISTGRTSVPNEVLPVNCTFDYTSITGIPALIGFMNEEYIDMTKEDRCNAVVQDLMRVFGERAMVWSREPFIGGAPSVFMPCGTMESWLTTREPFMTIHFAGAETASKWIGYMDGAVESGF